jgi:hypothetical protein
LRSFFPVSNPVLMSSKKLKGRRGEGEMAPAKRIYGWDQKQNGTHVVAAMSSCKQQASKHSTGVLVLLGNRFVEGI